MTFDHHQTKTQINSSSYQAGKNFTEAICQQGHVIKTRFVNCNVNSIAEGKNKRPGYYNYFIGDDTSKYVSFAGLYDEVIVWNIYDGIDLRYYFDKGFPRFDFIVHPHADPSVILLEFSGQEMIYAEGNNIHLLTPAGRIMLTDLKAYQNYNIITSSFVQMDQRFFFSIGNYGPSYTLTIDPLIYSTLFGSNEADRGQSLTFDKTGNIVITGFTRSKNSPLKVGHMMKVSMTTWMSL